MISMHMLFGMETRIRAIIIESGSGFAPNKRWAIALTNDDKFELVPLMCFASCVHFLKPDILSVYRYVCMCVYTAMRYLSVIINITIMFAI